MFSKLIRSCTLYIFITKHSQIFNLSYGNPGKVNIGAPCEEQEETFAIKCNICSEKLKVSEVCIELFVAKIDYSVSQCSCFTIVDS